MANEIDKKICLEVKCIFLFVFLKKKAIYNDFETNSFYLHINFQKTIDI